MYMPLCGEHEIFIRAGKSLWTKEGKYARVKAARKVNGAGRFQIKGKAWVSK